MKSTTVVEPAISHIPDVKDAEMNSWGWVSFKQLHEACCWRIEGFIMAQVETVREGLRLNNTIDLRDFVDLNFMPKIMNVRDHIPVPFSWVVCGKHSVHEFKMENPDNCSFLGPDTYCPAKWARRVLEATRSGVVRTYIHVANQESGAITLFGKTVYNLKKSDWNNHSCLLEI